MRRIKILYIGDLNSSFQRAIYNGLKKNGFKVFHFFIKPPFSFLKKIRLILNIILKGLMSDAILIEFLADYAWMVSKFKRILKKPIVVRCHRAELYEYYEKYQARVKEAASTADVIVCVSKAIRDRLLKLIPFAKRKVIVIYNGVDVDKFRPIKNVKGKEKGSFYIGSLGYLSPRKGFEELIDVVSKLVKDGYNIRLYIGGKGYLYKRLQEKIKKSGLSSYVKLEGFIPDQYLTEWYNKLDLFILNSRSEGHPVSLLEAMSCGLPVIATNVDGIPEILDAEWIYPPGDVLKLRELIKHLYKLPAYERHAIGAKNRQKVIQFFNQKIQINKFVKLLKALSNSSK